jgi:hypothetical protein
MGASTRQCASGNSDEGIEDPGPSGSSDEEKEQQGKISLHLHESITKEETSYSSGISTPGTV